MLESRLTASKSRIHAAISLKFSDHTSIPGVFKLDIVVLLRLFGYVSKRLQSVAASNASAALDVVVVGWLAGWLVDAARKTHKHNA